MKQIQEYLTPVTDCACGMVHTCPIRRVSIGENATKDLAEITAGFRSILVVADENTWKAASEKVLPHLSDRKTETLIYPAGDGFLVPDEDAITTLEGAVAPETDLILGIGSGVINDLCKYVSFLHKLPYAIVATAPSMDGYASVGAAMIIGGMKITYNAHVPMAIVGDTEILKNAPMDMIRSGFGDVVGKYSCLSDWKLAKELRGEYFCPFVYDMTMEMVEKTVSLAEGLMKRESAAVTALMEALVGVGIAMAYVGNSRPASGSEHHLSHYFEIVGILRKEPYFHHGIDVGYSTLTTAKMREEILSLPSPKEGDAFCREAWEKAIRRIYGSAAEGVIALQDKLGWYGDDMMPVYREKWDAVRQILSEVPSEKELSAILASVGFTRAEYEAEYSEEKRKDALFYAKDLKDRYTVLWLYDRLFRRYETEVRA